MRRLGNALVERRQQRLEGVPVGSAGGILLAVHHARGARRPAARRAAGSAVRWRRETPTADPGTDGPAGGGRSAATAPSRTPCAA